VACRRHRERPGSWLPYANTLSIARGFFGAPAGIFEIARAITVISRDRYEPAGQLALYEYRSGVDL
jgi:hypothetical protein